MIVSANALDTIRIRKYPNRRLYDTSRSTHLTHDQVLAIVRRGQRVQISDSRTEADITNEVLLQILIARDPEVVSAIPTNALLSLARGNADSVTAATGAFAALADAIKPATSAPAAAAAPMAGVARAR
jgi:polyhydroxyalkanoate synthesis repressor PhaR